MALAARVSPPAAEQFEKQRNGDFDWVLTVKPQAAPDSGEEKRLFFGCNLLPVLRYTDKDTSSKEELRSYTLLATPLEGDEEPVIDPPAAQETSMALAEAPRERLAPAKTGTKPLPAVRVEKYGSTVVGVRDGEDSYVPAVVSKMPAREVEGIEAIDKFEEDMEAFELAAGFKTTTSPSMGVTDIRSPKLPALSRAPVHRRGPKPAPQQERPSPSTSASKARSDRRPSPLDLLDSPKLKGEDKALAQASPRKTPSKTLASLQPLKPSVQSTKAPTVPASDLSGEAVAHRLEGQREARRSSQETSSQVVQDGGYKVDRRLGEKQQARVPTLFAQPKPHRPKPHPTGAWTAWATDGTSSEQGDDIDDKSNSDSPMEWIMDWKERDDNKRSTEGSDGEKRSTEHESDRDSKCSTEQDNDDASISDSTMEWIMGHANARLTTPTLTGRREKAERLGRLLRRLAEKESDENFKRSTRKVTDDDSMEVNTAPHNARLTPPTRTGEHEGAERLQRSSGPRRAKSTKALTLPRFELPGEAISRRKREEHEARRKAQEEEEQRRRQFKARPVRSAAAPSTVPRGTIASRARLNDTLFEKPTQQASPTQIKRASVVMGTQQAPPTQNKRASVVMGTQPRGRHLATSKADQAGPHASRVTSSSVGSTDKRSSVSLEEVQQQRVRGKGIFQRDSAFSQDRTKERRERETMARLAREEAAERSRQQSREWAEKQKRKRMTIGSVREVTTPREL